MAAFLINGNLDLYFSEDMKYKKLFYEYFEIKEDAS